VEILEEHVPVNQCRFKAGEGFRKSIEKKRKTS